MSDNPRRNLTELIARIGDLIAEVSGLANVIQTQGSNSLPEMMAAQAAAQMAVLAQIREAMTTLGSSVSVEVEELEAIRAAVARPAPWQAQADGGALILATTAKLLRAAPGMGNRLYVTHLQIRNANLLTEALVQIMDDATVIWSMPIGAGQVVGVPVNLFGSVNKPLNVKLASAITSGVAINAQGFTAS